MTIRVNIFWEGYRPYSFSGEQMLKNAFLYLLTASLLDFTIFLDVAVENRAEHRNNH